MFPGGLPQHRARGHKASPDANAPGCVPRAPPVSLQVLKERLLLPALGAHLTPSWAVLGATRVPRGYHGATTGYHGATAAAPPPLALPRRRGTPGRGWSRLGAAAHRGGPPAGAGRCGGSRRVPVPPGPAAAPGRARCRPRSPRVPVPPPLPACAAGSVRAGSGSGSRCGSGSGSGAGSVPGAAAPAARQRPPGAALRDVTARPRGGGDVTRGLPAPRPARRRPRPRDRRGPPRDPAPRPAHAWDVPGGAPGPQSLAP